MQIATDATTGQQVVIVSVNGGWTTIRSPGQSSCRKVRNGALSKFTEVVSETVREYALAEAAKSTRTTVKADRAAPAPRVKMAIEDRKNGRVDPLYLQFYSSYATQLPDGTTKRSIDKGDRVALLLRSLTLDAVYQTASGATGTSVAGLRQRFERLNPGMQRMNLGNMLRRALKQEAASV